MYISLQRLDSQRDDGQTRKVVTQNIPNLGHMHTLKHITSTAAVKLSKFVSNSHAFL